MPTREQNIQSAIDAVGWAYADLNWVTEHEAARARTERQELLDSLPDKVVRSFSGTKLQTGPLSPGCRLCGEGFWSCVFINKACTADCFFCPQDRRETREQPVYATQGIDFKDPDDYADYVASAGYRGVGFSEGEPLLEFDRLLAGIKAVRERGGDGLFLWLYTNGDLVDEDKLVRLRDSGLNEIRFNTFARNYGLNKVERAAKLIPVVTVEIPAVPEDYEAVRRSLKRMEEIGVSHLNLHQLLATRCNYKNLSARNYTFLHQPSITILESELSALRLMQYAVMNDVSLPINYCGSFYKSEFQTRGHRARISALAMEEGEEMTENGHIRRMTVRRGEDQGAESIIRSLDPKALEPAGGRLLVSYFEPSLKIDLAPTGADRAPRRPFREKIVVEKKLLYQLELEGASEIKGFLRFVFDKEDEARIRRDLLENGALKTREDLKRTMDTILGIGRAGRYEHLGTGLSEIY